MTSNPHLPPGVAEIDVLEGVSLPRRWVRNWMRQPDAVVLEDGDGLRITCEELEECSRIVAGRFSGAGLEPGDRLLLSADPSLDLIVAYVAALRYGLIAVPANTAYGPEELAHIVRNTGPAAAIVDDNLRAKVVKEASNGRCRTTGADVMFAPGSAPTLDLAVRDTPALICHTSGTTGKPKGAVLTHGNLLASAEAVRVAWRWEPEDKLALALPLFHLHGLGVGVNGTLVAGASLVLTGPFRPAAVAEAIQRHHASLFFGVPTMYHRLVEGPDVSAFASLRLCVSGSAPLPASLHASMIAACGQHVLERYGMTETVMNVSNPYNGERRPGSVGFPLPGVEIRVDSSCADEAGELHVRGPNVFAGYWNDRDATECAFSPGHWFATGDIGAFDPDGYLRIVGRSKELIITGGYNVYPAEVEDVVRQCPGVADVAVVGTPSDEWGETVTAFVVADSSLDPNAIIEFAACRLANYKRPRLVRIVEALPRNALGKVLRSDLANSR